MEEVTNVIESLGFPIVVCIILAYALKYLYDSMKELNEKQQEKHAEEITALTTALNNNTVVIQKLCDRMDNIAGLNPPEYSEDGTGD